MDDKLRVGIVCAGTMAKRMAKTLSKMEKIEVTAIASLEITKAARIAKKYQIPNVFDSYEVMAGSSDVDLVYIAAVNNAHRDLIRMFLNNGKHVFCEKPLTMTGAEARELYELAGKLHLFLGEAMWLTFLPQIVGMKKAIEEEKIGIITKVSMSIGFDMRKKERLLSKEMGGGALRDIGIYQIALCNMIFGTEYDELCTVQVQTETGVDKSSITVLLLKNGVLLTIESDLSQKLDNRIIFYGTDGRIVLEDFLIGNEVTYFTKEGTETVRDESGRDVYSYEWENVIRTLSAERNSNHENETISSLELIDDIMKKWRVKNYGGK